MPNRRSVDKPTPERRQASAINDPLAAVDSPPTRTRRSLIAGHAGWLVTVWATWTRRNVQSIVRTADPRTRWLNTVSLSWWTSCRRPAAKKTKGNRLSVLANASNTLGLPHKDFAASTQKLLELEYGYAKDAAMVAIQQRAGMMRVYIAIVGIAVAAAATLMRDGVSPNELVVLFLISGFVLLTSIYFMRGLILLRSDWYDYVLSMAAIKVFMLRLEKPELRNDVRTQALVHDPLNPPTRNLKTNFFYHSYILCSCVAGASAFCLVLLVADAQAGSVTLQPWAKWMMMIGLFAFSVAVAVAVAGSCWERVLSDQRSDLDQSPLDRAR
jgi:hypothetical protein